MSLNIFAETIITSSFRALLRGNQNVRIFFLVAAILITVAILSEAIFQAYNQYLFLRVIAAAFGVTGGLIIFGIGAYQVAFEQKERDTEVQKIEDKVRDNPKETQVAWELGRIKLESYLNRNLKQVKWIFILTLIVMIAGFVIIGYGVVRVYETPENISPSVVVTVSGLLVEFIAATFLLIYRSTIEQAKEYVNILERINAVGMSVQILDSIENNNTDLRDKTRADIAKGLLSLYSSINHQNTSETKSSK